MTGRRWEYTGRMYVRPMNRGVVLDDIAPEGNGHYLDDNLEEVFGNEDVVVRIVVEEVAGGEQPTASS